jgi:hypothetical protein
VILSDREILAAIERGPAAENTKRTFKIHPSTPGDPSMAKRRFTPKLNKKLYDTRDGYKIYTVNDYAIRNSSQPDEEFDHFATHDEYPDLIGKDEIWVSQSVVAREGEFFIANALARLKALAKGDPEDKAYTVGLNAERRLREEVTGLDYRGGRPHKRIPGKVYDRHYVTLPDEKFPVEVWLVDGCWVRSLYKTDYTEGGHGYVYPWCPKKEIWVEKVMDRAELPFIVAHEYTELRLMRDEDLDYDRAHEICSEVEFDLRKADRRRSFPGFSRRRPRKEDLRRLTSPEYFDHVKRNYVHGIVRRAAAYISDIASKVLP